MLTFPTFPHGQGNSCSTRYENSQIKMCFWLFKADVSLTGCPVFMLSATCISVYCPLYSPLCGTLCHLTSSAYFPEILFPPAFPFLLVVPSAPSPTPISNHVFQCLAWSSHFSQSPFSVKPDYLADKHFGTSYLLFLMPLTYSFFGIQMSTGRNKWKRHERLILHYHCQLLEVYLQNYS